MVNGVLGLPGEHVVWHVVEKLKQYQDFAIILLCLEEDSLVLDWDQRAINAILRPAHVPPESPKLVTEIPGPVSKQRMAELNAIQSMASVQFFADYDKLVETFFKKWANTGLFLFIFVLFKQFYRIKTVDISGIRTRMD